MLRGELITGGWQSEEVKDALEWCLGCKGCRSDGPTHTDMAAYRAEFFSHYYEHRARPRQAWSMGRIGEWAPLASRFPGLVNALAPLGKRIAGIAAEREMPKFRKSFRSQFTAEGKGEPVILFDDTFNNHLRPQTMRAAQKVLEDAGCAVELPREHVCCGRPYYDYGMLDQAKATLSRALEVLDGSKPIVVLEPGCLSVFRDELKQLFPDGRQLPVMSLGEMLLKRGYKAKTGGKMLVHTHCHQKALWGAAADLQVLKDAGCEVIAPDTGCCGMAGSFGYRPEFYDTSKRIAGLALLPALQAAPEARVVASGFSCREQIEALGGRQTLHLAEVLA
jgi:Fe-S oxidoreductase